MILPLSATLLRISTSLQINPEFLKSPRDYSRVNGVPLVNELNPETSYTTDREAGGKIAKEKTGFHLVRQDAIRAFMQSDGGVTKIRSIDLRPSVLLYGVADHPLDSTDVLLSLSILRNTVLPLLANPGGARHIVPGLSGEDSPVAYWRIIESAALLDGIALPSLHHLHHSDAGSSRGNTAKLVQLGDDSDQCSIRLEGSGSDSKASGASPRPELLRVSLRHRGDLLVEKYEVRGKAGSVGNAKRLMGFEIDDLNRVYKQEMANLEGIHLPVPAGWREQVKLHARTLALLSHITAVALPDLRAFDEEIHSPSRATKTRLNKEIQKALADLKPVPVSSLFGGKSSASPKVKRERLITAEVDPSIAAVYGPSNN